MDTVKNDIQFTLLENGLDFIGSALSYLDDPIQPTKLKYAILHLSAGIELVLKERLQREHWSLLFSRLDKASKHAYESGKFTSPNFDECIERLINICGVKISKDERQHLVNLRDKRNKFEHFGIVDSTDSLKVTVADALNFVIDFIGRELDDEQDDVIAEYMEVIKEEALKFDTFVFQRWESIKSPLKSLSFVVTCPSCLQNAGSIDDGIFHCLFCGYENGKPEEVANEYISEVLGVSQYEVVTSGGEWPLYYCPDCETETLVAMDEGYICFCCGIMWEYGELGSCDSCGTPIYENDGGISLCEQCLENKLSAWD